MGASVRNSFISIYFSHFKLFLPTNTHSPNTCSHFRYDLTTCSLPLISFHFHHSHQVRTFANTAKSIRRTIEEQELSTREALRQAPSPIRSHIARRHRSTTLKPTPPQTRDATLYREESSPRGLPTSTIPHDGMKRRQVAESESVPRSPTLGRHLEAQTTAPHRGSQWPSLSASLQPYSR